MTLAECKTLAEQAMLEHGLTARGWRFEFDNAKRRFGACHHGLRKITLSRELVELNGKMRVYNTILHEIAHALAPRTSGHDATWRAIAKSIGCDGERLYSSLEVAKPKHPFIGTCPGCKRQVHRYKRMQIACGQCCKRFNNNRFDSKYLFTWTRSK